MQEETIAEVQDDVQEETTAEMQEETTDLSSTEDQVQMSEQYIPFELCDTLEKARNILVTDKFNVPEILTNKTN